METIELQAEINGTGEVKGVLFQQVYKSEKAYIYEATPEEGKPYFEVFKRKAVPVCIDFVNKVFSETQTKEVYPKSKQFGIWAWSSASLAAAKIRAKRIEANEESD